MNLKKLSIQWLSVVIGMTTLKANATCAPLLDHSVRQLAGEQVDRLCEVYQGQVVLIVNTASKCGLPEIPRPRVHGPWLSVQGFW